MSVDSESKLIERLSRATRFDAGDYVDITRHWTVGSKDDHHWKIVNAVRAYGADASDLESAMYGSAEEAFETLETFKRGKKRV